MASNSKNIAELLNTDTTLDAVDIAAGAVDTAELASGAVTTAKIADSNITTAKIANSNITNAKLSDTVHRGRRNVLINGSMNVRQRDGTFTYTGGIWVYGGPDRWAGHFDGSPTGASRIHVAGGPSGTGAQYFVELRGGTSGGTGGAYLSQRIESVNLQGIRDANTATVSGWVKRSGSAASTFTASIICPTATDNYGSYTTHGSAFTDNETISGDGTVGSSSFTLTTVDTWYYFSATVPNFNSLTNSDKGMQLYFAVGGLSTTADKYQFTQIQLEAGTEATPFEHISFGEELKLCQRYYISNRYGQTPPSLSGSAIGIAHSTSEVSVGYTFPNPMRTTPTIVMYDNSGNANRMHRAQVGDHPNAANVNNHNQYGIGQFQASGITTGGGYMAGYTASAEL